MYTFPILTIVIAGLLMTAAGLEYTVSVKAAEDERLVDEKMQRLKKQLASFMK